jgi:hypothetical protein
MEAGRATASVAKHSCGAAGRRDRGVADAIARLELPPAIAFVAEQRSALVAPGDWIVAETIVRSPVVT